MHKLKFIQKLPVSIVEAWDFFSSPVNLKTITPPFMGFDVTSGNSDEKMYEGMLITYRVRPVFNIPVKWVSEITHVVEHEYFIDEQRFGPYKMWHHLHRFTECDDGIIMTDEICYIVGFGFIGRMINTLIVRKKLNEIFDYRRKKLETIFTAKAVNA